MPGNPVPESTKDFAGLLRQARRVSGLTQDELAERAGISTRAVSDLERGISQTPRRDTLELIMDALGLSPDERREWERLRLRLSRRTQPKGQLRLVPAPEELSPRVLPLTNEPGVARLSQWPAQRFPLVGRASELGRLVDAWQDTARGRCQLAVVSGEAGIGKTRLAEELIGHVEEAGFATAIARCFAAEGALAYSPVISWLRSPAVYPSLPQLDAVWLREIARLVPELLGEVPGPHRQARVQEAWQRQVLFEALVQAVLQARLPLMLVLDDAHWADEDTLQWLRYLLHAARAAPIMILAIIRSEELRPGSALQQLIMAAARDGQLVEHELGPLTEEETTSLASTILGRPLDPVRGRQLFRETEGNALFVVEAVRDESWVSGADCQTVLSPTVRAVIDARLEQLEPDVADICGVSAVIGREFSFSVLSLAAARDEDATLRALEELLRRRIVRERELDRFDFSHDRIREAAYQGLSATRRMVLHRRVAQALEELFADQRDAVCGEIARHFDLAGLSQRAVPNYVRAAEIAQRSLSHGSAVGHLRRAMALFESVDSKQGTVEWRQLGARAGEALGVSLLWMGEAAEAETAFRGALELLASEDGIARSRLYVLLGRALFAQKAEQEGVRCFDLAETALGAEPHGDAAEWWEAWIDSYLERVVSVYFGTKHYAGWEELQPLIDAVREPIRAHGTLRQRAQFLHRVATIRLRRDRYVTAPETLEERRSALSLFDRIEDPAARYDFVFNLGFAELWATELDQAALHLQEYLECTTRVGYEMGRVRALTYLSILARRQGNVELADRLARTSLEAA